MIDRIENAWHLHRRFALVAASFVLALLVFLGATAIVIRASGGGKAPTSPQAAPPTLGRPTGAGTPQTHAPGVSDWDAITPVRPATSSAYPAVPTTAANDPGAYAQAFARELFTRDYAKSTRDQVIAWAQYEDAPLQSPKYPRPDWTKVLVDSLTDLSWDSATDTPVPAVGVWNVLATQHAIWRVSGMTARTDPQWQQQIVDGYEPPDPMTTIWDVSLRITQTSNSGDSHRFDVSIAIQLGTSARGDYGVAATNDFVIREAG